VVPAALVAETEVAPSLDAARPSGDNASHLEPQLRVALRPMKESHQPQRLLYRGGSPLGGIAEEA